MNGEEFAQLRKDIKEMGKQAHESHREIWEEMRTKTPLKIFMWVIGIIVLMIMSITVFQWNAITNNEEKNQALHHGVNEKLYDIREDVSIIKAKVNK